MKQETKNLEDKMTTVHQDLVTQLAELESEFADLILAGSDPHSQALRNIDRRLSIIGDIIQLTHREGS